MDRLSVALRRMPHADGLDLPAHETDFSAGADLRAAVPANEPVTLVPGEWKLIPTGIQIALPKGLRGTGSPSQRTCVSARRHRSQQPRHDRRGLPRRGQGPSHQPRHRAVPDRARRTRCATCRCPARRRYVDAAGDAGGDRPRRRRLWLHGYGVGALAALREFQVSGFESSPNGGVCLMRLSYDSTAMAGEEFPTAPSPVPRT